MKLARRAPLVLAVILLAIPMRVNGQEYAGQLGVGVYSPSPYTGPVAPDFFGETGLFTVPTADSLPARGFSLALYIQNLKLVAAEDPNFPASDRHRLHENTTFRGSLAYGLGNHFEIFASAGEERDESRGGWQTGVINGQEFSTSFKLTDPAKLRIGVKISMWEPGSKGRLAIYAAAHAPLANDQDFVETRRTDWEFGASGSYGILTGNVSYTLSGRRSTDPDSASRSAPTFPSGPSTGSPSSTATSMTTRRSAKARRTSRRPTGRTSRAACGSSSATRDGASRRR
jgi:hypothetical protein